MTNSAAGVDDSTALAREANRRQAEYYCRLLVRQRAAIDDQLAHDDAKLVRHAWDSRESKRLKRGIRRKQTERHTLDCLIAALEQRLATGGQEA